MVTWTLWGNLGESCTACTAWYSCAAPPGVPPPARVSAVPQHTLYSVSVSLSSIVQQPSTAPSRISLRDGDMACYPGGKIFRVTRASSRTLWIVDFCPVRRTSCMAHEHHDSKCGLLADQSHPEPASDWNLPPQSWEGLYSTHLFS